MGSEQCRFPGPVAGGPGRQRADARDVQAERLQQQHREEQVRLVAEHQPGCAPAAARLGAGESQHAEHDVRVCVHGVGVGVVPVVLAHPPAVTQTDGEVADQDA